jgi:nitrite reductase/ring-hydroxylating ferredoxin subunit
MAESIVPPPGTPQADSSDLPQPQWREDFPIDVPRDQFVARRDFTRFLVLISGAFAIGQLWIALQNLWRRTTGKPPLQRLAGVEDLPVGGSLLFHYPTHHDGCLLIRTAVDQFVAYGNECTHLMCAVVPRVSEQRLYCPCHVGFFDLATGRPTSGPPRRPLPQIVLAVRNGGVFATDVIQEAR